MYSNHLYLVHHGIKGQKWGVKNGPPYPLDQNDKSAAEKSASTQSSKSTTKEETSKQGQSHAKVSKRIHFSQASVKEYGSGHIKDQHREAVSRINQIADRRRRERLLAKEDEAYKKALKNQEKTDKLHDAHEQKLQGIDDKHSNKLIKSILTKNENTKYKDALNKQEKVNDGRAAIKKALIVGGAVAVTAGLIYLNYKSSAKAAASKQNVENVFKKLDIDGGTSRYAEALKHNFSDVSTADAYHLGKNFSQNTWKNVLSDKERDGIELYTGSYYTAMNGLLRDPTGFMNNTVVPIPNYTSHVQDLIDGCTDGLNKCVVAEDCIVHRGIGSALPKCLNISPSDLLVNPDGIIGMRFVDKGFVSTGVSTHDAWAGVKMHIYVPKGSKGMYVDPISMHPGEHELLLQRGCEFAIRAYSKGSNGEISDIFVDLVNQLV